MASLRRALLIFVCAATAGAAIVGYLVLGGTPARLIVDAALLVSLALIVWLTLTPTVKRVDDMVEALRALARGDKHQRVNAEDFAGLAEVARGVNEVAAALTEHDDANLGPVHSKPRINARPTHIIKPNDSTTPELGQVRVHKRPEPAPRTEKTREPTAAAPEASAERAIERASVRASDHHAPNDDQAALRSSGSTSASFEPRFSSEPFEVAPGGAILSGDVGEPRPLNRSRSILAPPVGSEPSGPIAISRPPTAAPNNDTAVDQPGNEPGASDDGSRLPVSLMPTRGELEALFTEFVTAKKGKDESVSDLDLDAFAQTIQGECERLLQAHACKGVRFEVTEQDGEVSLRPRLIR